MKLADRVIAWNAARYDQVNSAALTHKLLAEEIDELEKAKDPVEVLDAIGDIAFVVGGALWKAGFDRDSISFAYDAVQELHGPSTSLNYLRDFLTDNIVDLTDRKLDKMEHYYAELVLRECGYALFLIIPSKLRELGLLDEFKRILNAICDSNDTKEVKGKVAANVKANITKGANFVPPTEALKTILAEAH